MNLGSLFTGIGEAGAQFSGAQLAAAQERVKRLFDQLNLKEGEASLQERAERLRRLKLQPETDEAAFQQKIATIEKVLGRPLTPSEKQIILGLQPKTTQTGDEETIALIEKHLGRKLNEDELQRYFKIAPPAPKAAGRPLQEKTYDPVGHLRYASVDPQTQQVIAWGPEVPESEATHFITDTQTGEVQAIRMPRIRKVVPGEILMSPQAQQQWDTISRNAGQPAKAQPKPTRAAGGATPGSAPPAQSGGPKPNIVAHITPKYTVPLNTALRDAQGKYTTWITAMKNAEYKSPKTDLAIVFGAVRAQVQGAGRMTNVELERELKAGSYGDRSKRWYEMATSGTLPDDQRQDLLNVIRDSWIGSAQTAREAWQSDRPTMDMPEYIKAPAAPSASGPVGTTASTTGAGKTVKIGGKEVSVGADGTFMHNGKKWRVNPDGKGATEVREP